MSSCSYATGRFDSCTPAYPKPSRWPIGSSTLMLVAWGPKNALSMCLVPGVQLWRTGSCALSECLCKTGSYRVMSIRVAVWIWFFNSYTEVVYFLFFIVTFLTKIFSKNLRVGTSIIRIEVEYSSFSILSAPIGLCFPTDDAWCHTAGWIWDAVRSGYLSRSSDHTRCNLV